MNNKIRMLVEEMVDDIINQAGYLVIASPYFVVGETQYKDMLTKIQDLALTPDLEDYAFSYLNNETYLTTDGEMREYNLISQKIAKNKRNNDVLYGLLQTINKIKAIRGFTPILRDLWHTIGIEISTNDRLVF